MVVSESSFGAYFVIGGLRGSTAISRSCSVKNGEEQGDTYTGMIWSEVEVCYLENGSRLRLGPFSRYQTDHQRRYLTLCNQTKTKAHSHCCSLWCGPKQKCAALKLIAKVSCQRKYKKKASCSSTFSQSNNKDGSVS